LIACLRYANALWSGLSQLNADLGGKGYLRVCNIILGQVSDARKLAKSIGEVIHSFGIEL